MLLELHINNVAVIDELSLDFGPGLNVLTGETGAGKSIILGSLGLVLGEKAAPHIIRTGEDSARVDAVFTPDLSPQAYAGLADAGVPLSDGEPIIVTRQVQASGRSRALVNGGMTTNAVLKQLGEDLVDLHGQHEHQSLFRVSTHMDLLDAFAGAGDLRASVAESYHRIQTQRRELRQLQDERQNADRERDLLEHEIDELDKAELRENEDEELEAERARLVNAETLNEKARAAYDGLYASSDGAALGRVRAASSALGELTEIDESVRGVTSRLETLQFELEDIALALREYCDRIEFAPARLDAVEERLQEIFQLKRKYGATIPDVRAYHESAKETLEQWRAGSARINEVKRSLRSELAQAGDGAFGLSDRRIDAAKELQQRVEGELRALGMAKARFEVAVVRRESESGLIRRSEKSYKVDDTGVDDVEFLIAPNPGEESRPLNRIASGGEISRTMLALKNVLSEVDPFPTLLFDEVDAGIGGDTATVVGQRLAVLAATTQVICITHLPQIAAVAARHFAVEKTLGEDSAGSRTRTMARPLEGDDRVAELARMLGGDMQTSRAHAQELLRLST